MLSVKHFQDVIDSLKESGNYRVFNDILRERGEYPNAIWYGKYNIKNIEWVSQKLFLMPCTLH
jgi:hypothetical protein